MSGLEEIVASLLVWISANSGYETEQLIHPAVRLMTAEEITKEYYSGSIHNPPTVSDPRIYALYAPGDGPKGTIYLRHTGTNEELQNNIILREALLHELVHHVQWQTGKANGWKCQNEGELEAYMLGAEYLRQQSQQDHLLSRQAWARIYSTC